MATRDWARSVWFALLVAAICFEGLGRKFVTEIPGVLFYLAKDAVLVGGLLAFGIRRDVFRTAGGLFRGFLPFLPAAFAWTLLEMANPDQPSLLLALLGLRAYWLWWLAPLVVASLLERERDRGRAMVILGLSALFVATFALVQFALPPDHPLNRYAATGPDMDIATVATTGRARVTSTFSYITGFTDFVTIVPALLLSLGLASHSRAQRLVLMAATALSAIAMPASGSRSPVVLGLGTLAIVAASAGLLRTRQGRRVVAAGALGLVGALVVSDQAIQGVRDRFESDPRETRSRFAEAIAYVPPFALGGVDSPIFGTGTGTLQNAAASFGMLQKYSAEGEPLRIVVEQGAPGYLLLSAVRVGLVVALVRAGFLLRRRGERAGAGGSWALAALTLPGTLFFDHIFQALYFLALGVVLASVVRAQRKADFGTPRFVS